MNKNNNNENIEDKKKLTNTQNKIINNQETITLNEDNKKDKMKIKDYVDNEKDINN